MGDPLVLPRIACALAAATSLTGGAAARPDPLRRHRTVPRALVACVLAVLLGGCATATPIGTLMDDPFQHDRRQVTVQGHVREAVGFLGPGIYRLEDDSGSMPVVSQEGGAPRSGAEVRVKGTFRAAFTVAGRSLAVLVEEKRETP